MGINPSHSHQKVQQLYLNYAWQGRYSLGPKTAYPQAGGSGRCCRGVVVVVRSDQGLCRRYARSTAGVVHPIAADSAVVVPEPSPPSHLAAAASVAAAPARGSWRGGRPRAFRTDERCRRGTRRRMTMV